VLDVVAGLSFKTPTAVAEMLVGRFIAVARRLEDAATRLRSVWWLRREGARERLRRAQIGLRQGTRKLLDQRRSELLRAWRVRAEVQDASATSGWLAEARLVLRERAPLRERRAMLACDYSWRAARGALRMRASGRPSGAGAASGRPGDSPAGVR
jgi:exonuclease VII large subunit